MLATIYFTTLLLLIVIFIFITVPLFRLCVVDEYESTALP